MRSAPAAAHRRDQEGAEHRAAAVRGVVLGQEELDMEVILREDIEKLGNRGEVVKVAPGYARNFLIPKRLAVAATESNKKIVEQEREAHLRKEAKLQTDAAGLGQLLSKVVLTFKHRVGENDQLFGSVTAKDIADALEAQKYHVERRRVLLQEPIRSLGEHTVNVRLHRDVTSQIKVIVEPE